MVEVYKNIYVGDKYDFFENEGSKEFAFCLCAKTFHKIFAKVQGDKGYGYDGNLPKTQPEYLIADRTEFDILAVNLIDGDDKAHIPKEAIDKCLEFVKLKAENTDKKVLICCDKGQSRSVGIAMMYGINQGFYDELEKFEEVLNKFRFDYPYMAINQGMYKYTFDFWEEYKKEVICHEN